MARFHLNPWDVTTALNNISFSNRICADGECCSFDLDDPALPPDLNTHIFFWILEYKKYLKSYAHYIFRVGCPELKVRFSLKHKNLIIESYCSTYEHRDTQCREWGERIKCNFREYVEEIKRDGFYSSIFIMILKEDVFIMEYSFLSSFNLLNSHPELMTSFIKKFAPNAILLPLPATKTILPNH